jgi:hypothetical protein
MTQKTERRPSRGRPEIGKPILVRISPELRADLEREAKRRGVKLADVIRERCEACA